MSATVNASGQRKIAAAIARAARNRKPITAAQRHRETRRALRGMRIEDRRLE